MEYDPVATARGSVTAPLREGVKEVPCMKPESAKQSKSNTRHGISELFINRPITTTLVMVAFVLFGLLGYRALPVSDLPTVDYPTISVNASLPGANPETMAASVATPLERQFSGIAGIDSINSSNSQGSTSVTLQFNLSRNIDAAAQDVQTAISAALPQLPPDMPTPPGLRKVNPADSPILFLSLNSDRSEEHTSELQSQSISYAVFCLKKKKNNKCN